MLNAISWRAFWTAAAALGWKDGVDSVEYRRVTDELLRDGVLIEDHGTIWFSYVFTGEPRNILDEMDRDERAQ